MRLIVLLIQGRSRERIITCFVGIHCTARDTVEFLKTGLRMCLRHRCLRTSNHTPESCVVSRHNNQIVMEKGLSTLRFKDTVNWTMIPYIKFAFSNSRDINSICVTHHNKINNSC